MARKSRKKKELTLLLQISTLHDRWNRETRGRNMERTESLSVKNLKRSQIRRQGSSIKSDIVWCNEIIFWTDELGQLSVSLTDFTRSARSSEPAFYFGSSTRFGGCRFGDVGYPQNYWHVSSAARWTRKSASFCGLKISRERERER